MSADNEYNFQKLTPVNDVDLGIYKDALDFVFENPDVKNVGVSGAYSAGKSSVIETYKKLNPDKKFLHISLAYFQSTSNSEQKPQNENVLEGKILNQLIHQIDPCDIPQTNFRVKRQLSSGKMLISTAMVLLLAVLLIYLCNFNKWCVFYSTISSKILGKVLSFTVNPLSALFSGAICAAILSWLIYKIVQVQCNKKIFKSISVQGNTIEIFEKNDESYFDKYLNEVLYLFENCNKDVIVFEDIDRYDNSKIFQRLREMNSLINNRKKSTDKPLRFFYLLKDEIFINKERTKFFDFIMPVVPVLDGSNSFDQFIALFKQGNIYSLFTDNFLQNISLYIDDMRILKNIYNEFIIYNKRISITGQDPNKLLAIIIYKNVFPRDFSDLQLNCGYIHTLFSKKGDFVTAEVARLNQQIDEINKTIKDADNEHLKNVEEVNTIYDPQINKCQYAYGSSAQLTALRKEKNDRIENLNNKAEERKNDLNKKLSIIEASITSLQHKKLHEIINKQNVETIFKITYINEIGKESNFNDIKGSEYFALIKYLIRYGYIDETYPDYMTYFYEESLSRVDKIFLRSVIDEDAKEYTYKLKKPGVVLARLSSDSFNKEEVLNIDLLAYLLEHGTTIYKKQVTKILMQIKSMRNYKFISQYFESEKNTTFFVRDLNSVWPDVFNGILEESNFTAEQKDAYALESIYSTATPDLKNACLKESLSRYISTNKNFLQISEPNIQRLIEVLELIQVKFEDIDYEQSNKALFQAIYQHSLYSISFKLINIILKEIYGCFEEEDLQHKTYTLILSKKDEPLVNYVQQNINEFLIEMLKNCNGKISDSEETVIKLLNNNSLQNPLKVEYIDNLETMINNLKDVEDASLWPKLFTYNLVSFSESNVLHYFFSENGLDTTLETFVNEKGDSLHFNYKAIQNEYGEEAGSKFFSAIVESKTLNIKPYEMILKSLNRIYNKFTFDGVPDQKMDVLIEQGIVAMTTDNLLYMRAHYSHKVVYFITHNIEKYVENIIPEGNFDFPEFLQIMDTNIDDRYKLSLLQYTEVPISAMGSAYSDEIKTYILKNNFDSRDIPKLFKAYPSFTGKLQATVAEVAGIKIGEILEKEYIMPMQLCAKLFAMVSIPSESKLQLLAISVVAFNESECKECLEMLNQNDLLSAFDGKRPAIPITDTNRKILDIFVLKHWISSYSVDRNNHDMYRISSIRVWKHKLLSVTGII